MAALSPIGRVPMSRGVRVQNFAEAMAQAILELGADAGLDVHEIAAALAVMVDRLAEKISPPGLHGPLVRKIASETWRRAPLPGAAPVGRTFGELEALRIVSRLIADVEAVRKLCPEIGAFDDEVLVCAHRLMGEAGFRRCRVCGCSEHDACPGPCAWVEEDLCSRCAGENHPSQSRGGA